MYNVAILLPSLEYRNNTNGAINKAAFGIVLEQLCWLSTVLLAVLFTIFSIESRVIWCACLIPPIVFDFSLVFLGIKVLKFTISWCFLSDVIIRIVHIIGLLSRGICLIMIISNMLLGKPELQFPLAFISGVIIFQVLFASFSSSLRCPWIIMRFLFFDIWIGLLLFQIFLRINSEFRYYSEISKENYKWESYSQFHENMMNISEKLQHIPSWWVVFWPCWFWCAIIFSFSTLFCVLGFADKILGIFGMFFGFLSTSTLIGCFDLANFLNSSIYIKDNKYNISYNYKLNGSNVRIWHICFICAQTLIAILSVVISQSLIDERDGNSSGFITSSNGNFIVNNIKQLKKLISPYRVGSEITLNKRGTGVFHTVVNRSIDRDTSDEFISPTTLERNDLTTELSSSTVSSPSSYNQHEEEVKFVEDIKSTDIQDGSQEIICIICCDNNFEAVFLPCGHGGICSNCALKEFYRIGLCPTCRQATSAIAAYKNQTIQTKHSDKISAIIIATQDI
ncbi:hypothetical protein FG386_002076 [Cryptosporidium ryanae]|uniref:uncharacterized protein n=1 Tax=Cryptosporidium ryanae TaxID=515981 RepID=UPI00351A452C|nr:hypothetical protein FG386_002076 [Cryptosporidium ryanae]